MINFKESKTIRNYYVDIIAFLPFLLLLISGIIMLQYHGGKAYLDETMGINGNTWIIIHKILTVISLPIVLLHLALHYNWLKKLVTLKLKNKHSGMNISIFIIFLLCASTSLLSWLIFANSNIGEALRGIHNKLGILLIVFFAIHILNYYKWIVNMTKSVFKE